MSRTQDELRQIFNSGTATDADMDEYINAGYDYNVLGPKSKTLYDQRKAELSKTAPTDTPKANTTTEPVKTTPKPEPVKDAPSDPKGYNIKSIQKAYYDGTIDKSTRDYMMADAIAKFARNTGRDIGNIGAQFTGGSIDTNREEADWNKRNEALFQNKVTSEQAKQEGSEADIKRQKDRLEIEKSGHSQAASRLMSQYKNEASQLANKLDKSGNGKAAAIMKGVAGEFALLESGALSSVDAEDHIANLAATLGKAMAQGVITQDDANNYLEGAKSMVPGAQGINVNVGGGSLFGNKSTPSAAESRASNAVNQANNQALSSGSLTIEQMGMGTALPKVKSFVKPSALTLADVNDGDIRDMMTLHPELTPEAIATLINEYADQVGLDKFNAAASGLGEDEEFSGWDFNNLSNDQVNKLKDLAKDDSMFSRKDDKARTILSYLGIAY